MGGSQSTRSLNIKNESPIQVSEAAMKRMTNPEVVPVNVLPQHLISPKCIPQPDYKTDYDPPKSDEYWSKRIQELKNAHDCINKKMEEEYKKAIDDTGALFARPPTACTDGKLPPCQEQESKVIKCYKENCTKTLLCAQIVHDFNDCVTSSRSDVMASGA